MRLIRDGDKGWGVEGRGRSNTYHYTFTTRMTSALRVGSDESHFSVSLIVCDKVIRQCLYRPQPLKRKENEADSNRCPSAYQPNALPLGQTGSQN